MLKYSRQREGIKKILAATKSHPTADEVYAKIVEEYPKISLGTVYRNLSLLVSIGEAQKIDCGDGIDHFDADTSPHYHFRCRACGCVKDIPVKQVSLLNELASEKFDGMIEGHTTVFHGLCRECKEMEENAKIS